MKTFKRTHTFLPGDKAVCAVDYYQHFEMGHVYNVLDVDETCIFVPHPINKSDTFRLKACNFFKTHRSAQIGGNLQQIPKENIMLHIAVPVVSEGESILNFAEMARMINANELSSYMMADTSGSALKERIKMDIERNPSHRWLILSGNTIGEIAAPPVRFRSI